MLLNKDGSYASMISNYNTEILSTLPLDQFAYSNMNYNILQENRSRKNNTKHLLYKLQAGLDVDITTYLKFIFKFHYFDFRYDIVNHNTQ